jgi:DNA-binding YbaB/EbfC family protein
MGFLEGIGQLGGLLRQAQELQKQVQEMQERLAERRFEAEAGGGLVKATVDGRGQLMGIRLSPEAVKPDEVEVLEELIRSAVCSAAGKARECFQEEVGRITGGMNVPGLKEMLGLG